MAPSPLGDLQSREGETLLHFRSSDERQKMRGRKRGISEDGSVILFEGLTVNLRERDREIENRKE